MHQNGIMQLFFISSCFTFIILLDFYVLVSPLFEGNSLSNITTILDIFIVILQGIRRKGNYELYARILYLINWICWFTANTWYLAPAVLKQGIIFSIKLNSGSAYIVCKFKLNDL